jgi:hypothetical protein
MKTIHNPSDIKVGKLYKNLNPRYNKTVLYLGCINGDTNEKFLVIVVNDEDDFGIGKTVLRETPETSIWTVGFEEQD